MSPGRDPNVVKDADAAEWRRRWDRPRVFAPWPLDSFDFTRDPADAVALRRDPVARTQPVSSYQSVHKLSQVLGFALAALRLPHVVAAFFRRDSAFSPGRAARGESAGRCAWPPGI